MTPGQRAAAEALGAVRPAAVAGEVGGELSRVAIIGSCISRDLWRFRGGTVSNVLYISRTSLPSLFATPLPRFRPKATPPAGLKAQPHRALVTDVTKTALPEVLAFSPTHVIFDFIDERFDLLSAGGTLVTHSWELAQSGYLEQPAFRGAREIPRLSAACERLWLEAAAELAAFVRATPLAKATLILHSARWAEQRRTANGRLARVSDVEILPGRSADVGAHNDLLARYEAAFEAVMPPLHRIEAPAHRLADDAHIWGLSPFHYVPTYYDEVWRQLEGLGAVGKVAA
jgi:hypothetical protein